MTHADSRPDLTLIDRIIECEWTMFRRVRASRPTACQEDEKTFRLMRWVSHSVLPEDVLQSLLDDLEAAGNRGRNLMTEKYARMENLIPLLQDNPLIPRIVAVEAEWMQQLTEQFPLTFPGSGLAFKRYIACELETWSAGTIEKLHRFVMDALENNRNLVYERYTNLFRRLGYSSIEEREAATWRERPADPHEFRGC